MPDRLPTFTSSVELGDQTNGRGRRPVIFDILAPDRSTSLLPDDLKLVLHVNPSTMQFTYAKNTTRIQTRGGFVEFHWGDAAEEITFEAATGGFMRLYTGLSNVTGKGANVQGRRQTLAYDKYLDLLAMFHNNGAVFDANGNIVVQGYIKITFDGGVHIGWFDGNFTVRESAEKPYMFTMSTRFIIDEEIMTFRSSRAFNEAGFAQGSSRNGGFDVSQQSVVDPYVDPQEVVRARLGGPREDPLSLDLPRDSEGNVIL